MLLVGDMPKRNSEIYPKKIGLIDGDKRFSYKEVNLRINRLGNALQEMGLKKGEKVAVMAPNCHQFVELYFAVAKTGLVVVPVNTRFLAEEASRVINHSESSIFVYHNALEDVAAKVRENIPGVKHFISIWGGGNGGTYSYEDLVQKGSAVEPQEKIDQDDYHSS